MRILGSRLLIQALLPKKNMANFVANITELLKLLYMVQSQSPWDNVDLAENYFFDCGQSAVCHSKFISVFEIIK